MTHPSGYSFSDIQVAVFNGHVNNAQQRALAQLKDENPDWFAEVEVAIKDGVMAIFNSEPTDAIMRFAVLVTDFYTEKR